MGIAKPILVVDDIATSPSHVSAELRIGGRHGRVVVGVSVPGLLVFEQIPELLAWNTPAEDAVMDLLVRAHSGGEAEPRQARPRDCRRRSPLGDVDQGLKLADR